MPWGTQSGTPLLVLRPFRRGLPVEGFPSWPGLPWGAVRRGSIVAHVCDNVTVLTFPIRDTVPVSLNTELLLSLLGDGYVAYLGRKYLQDFVRPI